MKKLFLLLHVFSEVFIMSACKKEQQITSDNTATFNVVNGIINKTALIKMNGSINSSGINSSGGGQNRISFGSNLFFFSQAKNTDVAVLNSTDSSLFVTKNIDFKKGGIYTMLLAGIAPNAEVVVIDDSNIPQIDLNKTPTTADSVMYFRFINLCPDSQPLDISLVGSTSNEFTGIPYKGHSTFKAYPNKPGLPSYQFQFIENGTVIFTRTVGVTDSRRFKTIDIVLMGLKSNSSLTTASPFWQL